MAGDAVIDGTWDDRFAPVVNVFRTILSVCTVAFLRGPVVGFTAPSGAEGGNRTPTALAGPVPFKGTASPSSATPADPPAAPSDWRRRADSNR